MKRKYYLVDTENVGDKWFGLLDKIRKKDRIVTFYTEHHSKRLREFLLRQVNNSQIIWMECAVGNNALDYQLMGVLGYLIVKHPKASYCIYSNDKGYAKAAEFWESRGIHVSLKGSDQKKKVKKAEKKKTKKKGKPSKANESSSLVRQAVNNGNISPGRQSLNNGKNSPGGQLLNNGKNGLGGQLLNIGKNSLGEQLENNGSTSPDSQTVTNGSGSPDTQTVMTGNNSKDSQTVINGFISPDSLLGNMQVEPDTIHYITAIAKSVPISNLNGWYCALTNVLGQTLGRKQYEKFKEDMQMREQLSQYCTGDRYSRGVSLTTLVLQVNSLDTELGESAYKIVQSYGARDLTKIKIALDKMIGQSPQSKNQYYNALRPMISLIHSL